MTTNQIEQLQNRLIMLEKCLQLKTNECAYYRTKVHLMQIKSKKNPRAQNQNFNEKDDCFNKQSLAQDKNIQCNDNEFVSNENSHTILMIRLPRRFLRSLQNQQTKSKFKVHFSSALLNQLFQSMDFNSTNQQFTIQSQFGPISASINPSPSDSKMIRVKAELHDKPFPTIRKRHVCRTSITSTFNESSLTNITNSSSIS